MKFASAHAINPDSLQAADEIIDRLKRDLSSDIDLLFFFVTADLAGEFRRIRARLAEELQPRVLLGCTAATVIEGDREFETGPALVAWAASLPHSRLQSFHVEFARTEDGIVCSGFPIGDEALPPDSVVILLADPFSTAPQTLIEQLAEYSAAAPLFGGMASGGQTPGENLLARNDAVHESGGVGVIITGGVVVDSVVSQGCRPIGRPFVITRAEDNRIIELGGKPALSRFEEIIPELTIKERNLVTRGLHVGIVMNEYQESFARGDFLISNVLGGDSDSGAIVIGNRIRVGQTVQFHVRDAETAHEDLATMLQSHVDAAVPAAQAALVFSCNGRGSRLFKQPDHDASTVLASTGIIPLAGFFAQGEFGPVANQNFVHGYTASVALFADPDACPEPDDGKD